MEELRRCDEMNDENLNDKSLNVPGNIKSDWWFPLHRLEKLRKDPAAFKFFCVNFLSIVVGVTKFRNKRTSERISEIATLSDEALVLLLLSNSWTRWVELGEKM